jgi:hypothetical protein
MGRVVVDIAPHRVHRGFPLHGDFHLSRYLNGERHCTSFLL